ncbi:MAG TPA: hypothetical protein VIC05_02300 [Solirubrobacteraceae bacterium]|jgi:hypothetical protein
MRNRRDRTSSPVERLRMAIDCLPVATRQAMLTGVRANERIIVGAYVDGEGGVCPMLAAHRAGGRTNFLSFAYSWDRFTGAGKRPRTATKRELRILVAQLEGSLQSARATDLGLAIAEHRALAPEGDPRGEIRALRLRGQRSRAGKDAGGLDGAPVHKRRPLLALTPARK